MDELERVDREIFAAIEGERNRQEHHLELIASENFTSPAVRAAMASILTNKYAEGYPNRRYYGGCEFVDRVEELARNRAKELFHADHVNVQPHSGTQANLAVYTAILKPGDAILTMDLSSGGHLSHGYNKNLSGMLYRVFHYGTTADGAIRYDEMETIARRENIRLVVVGASAYPRTIDFRRAAEIAHENGALILADMAHIAGLVAAGLHPSPFPHCDFVTTTTHKTLRGPRGGMIFCRKDFAQTIDSSVFPGNQGGPLMHTIAAKAICLKEAMAPDFKAYQSRVLANATALAMSLQEAGFQLVSGGTDNHLMLIDLRKNLPDLDGKTAQMILERAAITTNRNTVPNETRSPFQTSGLRLGTPALTTRGLRTEHFREIGRWIAKLLTDRGDDGTLQRATAWVGEICDAFPLFKGLDHDVA